MKKVTIKELEEAVKGNPGLKKRYDLISYLIGHNGVVTAQDYEHINALYMQKIIEL